MSDPDRRKYDDVAGRIEAPTMRQFLDDFDDLVGVAAKVGREVPRAGDDADFVRGYLSETVGHLCTLLTYVIRNPTPLHK